MNIPILVTGPWVVRYWERIDAVKAQVDPFPFVPVTWTILSLLRSDCYSTIPVSWNVNFLIAYEMWRVPKGGGLNLIPNAS